MARMSAGKSKKTTSQKGGVTKATRLPEQSKKNVEMPEDVNGSASDHMSARDPTETESGSLNVSQEHDGSVSDTLMSKQVFEAMDADGKNVSDPNSARHYRIAEQAFMLFQENGCQHGRDWADWFEAERQITQTRQSSRDE